MFSFIIYKTHMKTKKLLIGLAFTAILFYGCQKISNSTSTTDTTVPTSDEAASTIGASVSSNSYGLTAQLADAIAPSQTGQFAFTSEGSSKNTLSVSKNLVSAAGLSTMCGLVKDTVITRSNADTAKYHYAFYLNYKFMVNCTSNTFTGLTFSDSTSGTYVGPRVSYNGSSTLNTNLTFPTGSGDSVLIFNGTFIHNGTTVSSVGNKSTFTSTIKLTVSNLTIGKVSHYISAGTGTITITGTSRTGKSFSYTGTADFSVRNQMVVNILGQLYHFDLKTGNELTTTSK